MKYLLVEIIKRETRFSLSDNGYDHSDTILEITSLNEMGRSVILNFWHNLPAAVRRVEEAENTVTIHFAIAYFEQLYPLLHDALINKKYRATLVTILEDYNIWKPRFEFEPI